MLSLVFLAARPLRTSGSPYLTPGRIPLVSGLALFVVTWWRFGSTLAKKCTQLTRNLPGRFQRK